MFNFVKNCACFFVLIGAINWGLVGFFDFDLVAFLFGEMTTLTRIIYVFIAICAIIALISFPLSDKND